MTFNPNIYIQKNTSSSPLSVFRFFFGFLMCISIIRFWSKGWIKELYIDPTFHFSYYGFEWVKPLGDTTYLLFFICFISSFFICIGLKYRFSIILFFLTFTYIELMDKTTYLNHYYFVSVLSFLMIFLPANASFSIDNIINKKSYQKIPKWTIDSIKLLISIVYIYAAIAKVNSDWLFNAMPLKIWLTSNYDLVFLGDLFQKKWVHYFMSWSGMIYDFCIPFLLLNSRTRFFAFLLVVLFHALTKILFPIGMFPYIMILSSLIFFSPNFHDKIIILFKKLISLIKPISIEFKKVEFFRFTQQKPILYIVSVFFVFQFLFPFRYMLYPGELFWNEQGYRFSWRVMLVEKTAETTFRIVNPSNKKSITILNSDFLTEFQEKQMSFQPDMILEYAHYLGDQYLWFGEGEEVQVFTDSFVALNGRKSQRFINNSVDLFSEKKSLRNKKWILTLKDEIKGF
tara:strand:- start:45 stop:1412 length:1368 start_codon:yes stop_codon:yes gene_type:complete